MAAFGQEDLTFLELYLATTVPKTQQLDLRA